MKYDVIVVGCGYAGSIVSRTLAEQGKKVLLLERRNHIAGNMYDFKNEHGIYIHKYGPHISVMDNDKTLEYLSQFTEWVPYIHYVNVEIDDMEVPLPINLNSIEILFPGEKGKKLSKKLIDVFGEENNIPILEMLTNPDIDIQVLAKIIYDKVFFHYTKKMWGLSPEDIDTSVTARIPVRISRDNSHFLYKHQVMPKKGFTALFGNMINHSNITLQLNIDALNLIRIDLHQQKVLFKNEVFEGKLIYTGALDELFNYEYGKLPYRSLRFEVNSQMIDSLQKTTVLNWPDDRAATRRTEMKKLSQQYDIKGVTTTITEYPGPYIEGNLEFSEPYYPIIKDENLMIHHKYTEMADNINGLYYLGRLADYKYYNMEATVLRALDFVKKYF